MKGPDLASAVADVTSGAVVAFVAVSYSLSFAALIFSGPLGGDLSFGVSATLISTGVGAIVVAIVSRFHQADTSHDTPSPAH